MRLFSNSTTPASAPQVSSPSASTSQVAAGVSRWFGRSARIARISREVAFRCVDEAWQRSSEMALQLPPHQARGYLQARAALVVRRATRAIVASGSPVLAADEEAIERAAAESLLTLLVAKVRATREARAVQRQRAMAA